MDRLKKTKFSEQFILPEIVMKDCRKDPKYMELIESYEMDKV